MPERIHWRASLKGAALSVLIDAAHQSIVAVFSQMPPLSHYTTGDAQKATTQVSWPEHARQFHTEQSMHSEQVALAWMLMEGHWTLGDAGCVRDADGEEIAPEEYITDLPHCAHCSVMLLLMGLPLGSPTAGRYNLAVNLGYRLPDLVKEDLHLLARCLGGGDGEAGLLHIKQALNALITTDSSAWVLKVGDRYVSDGGISSDPPGPGVVILDWSDAKRHEVHIDHQHFGRITVLTFLWKLVFRGIYDFATGRDQELARASCESR